MLRDAQKDSPLANLPGLQGAQLEFDLSQKGGKARISVSNGSVTLPLGLDEPHLVLHEASAQLAWQLKGDDVALQFTQGRVLNDDLSGEFNGNWKTGEWRCPPAWRVGFNCLHQPRQSAQVYRYLPNTLPADVRAYVRDAVQRW